MKRLVIAFVFLFFGLCGTAVAFDMDALKLVYAERSDATETSKEYLVEAATGGGYHIRLFNQGVKRDIVTDAHLGTTREEYHNPATGDALTMSRHGDTLRLTGTLDGEAVDKDFEVDAPWYGSVLLLKEFALTDEEETLFYVTKPEEEKVVLLKAVREDVETVVVNGTPTEAVRIKYTVPGFRGMFWKSYYWYRTSDGLLVKTEETRGGPGTPKVFAELMEETIPTQRLAAELTDATPGTATP